MASIDAIPIDRFLGEIPYAAPPTALVTRPGLGQQGLFIGTATRKPVQIETRDRLSPAGGVARAAAYLAIEAQVVTVVDPIGYVHTGVLVQQVISLPAIPLIDGTVELITRWTLVARAAQS